MYHQGEPTERIHLNLSCYLSLPIITLGKSSKQHTVSLHN